MKYKTSHFATAALLTGGVIVAVFLCELVARIPFYGHRATYLFPPNFQQTFDPNPSFIPGISGKAKFTVNPLGLRGSSPPNDVPSFNILAIGGSSTECVYLDDEEAWPYLLEHKLNEKKILPQKIWVGNAGKAGLTLHSHILQIQKQFDIVPKIDLLMVTAGFNDLTGALALQDSYKVFVWNDPGSLQWLMQHTFSLYPRHYSFRPLKESALYSLYESFTQFLAPTPDSWDSQGRHIQNWRENRLKSPKFHQQLPDLSLALNEFKTNIYTIADLAAEKQIPLVWVTQPVLWKKDLSEELQKLLWFGGIGKAFKLTPGSEYYSVEALSAAMDIFNQTLLSVCKERQLSCVDLATRLPKDLSVFYDDVHFNESGARIVAEELSHYLSQIL